MAHRRGWRTHDRAILWVRLQPRTFSLLLVVVANDRDKAEHVVVQGVRPVHANDQEPAFLRKPNLYPIPRCRRGRCSCEERTGRISTGRARVTERHTVWRCGHSSGRRQQPVGVFGIVDTRVDLGWGRRGVILTRLDDEMVLGVGNVVIQVLGPDDHRSALARHNCAIAHGTAAQSIGLVSTALAEVLRDIVARGFLIDWMNRDTVTTAVDDERDRPTCLDDDIIRKQ